MDRFDAMTVFLAVVEAGSLSAAGRRLGMPLATVSRKVSELETHLKARLLNRSTRRLELTDTGRAYADACKRILVEVGEAERAATGEYSAPKGELVITAPMVFGRLHVLPVVTEFLLAYPAVNVRLTLGDRIAQLLDEHLDLAVRIGTLPDSSFKATGVGWLRRVVCGSPAYLASHGVPRMPADMGMHDCITFDAVGSADQWVFRFEKSESAVPVHSRLVVNTAEAAVDAAKAGLGLTRLLSYQIDAARRAGDLAVVLEAFEPPPIPVSLVFNAQQRIPLKLRAFLDFAAPRLRERMLALAEAAPTLQD
jgi:DNA-binding transcriptional LysR family regulator